MDNAMFSPLTDVGAHAQFSQAGSEIEEWQIVLPVPAYAPPALFVKHCSPKNHWAYRDQKGDLLCWICRSDLPGGGKTFLPYTLWQNRDGRQEWRTKHVPTPRPLYNLDALASNPDAVVVVCEGEKAADGGTKLFSDVITTTSPNGAKSARQADWSPMAGRRVIVCPDNDAEGEAYATEVVNLVHAAGALSVAIVQIPEIFPPKWDLADNLPDGVTEGDIAKLFESAQPAHANTKVIESIHEAKTVFAPTLQGKSIPERQWIWDDWILSACVTALYGDGGIGKSLLAMMMLTCVSLGIPFLGIKTKQMKVLGFFCEDTEDELHRRQADINAHYGIDFDGLQNLCWQSRVGCDNVLMDFIREGKGQATAAYNTLREEVLRVGAQFVVIDTAADTFGGNENIRQQVRQFINLLGGLALEIDGAVVLCAHPSVSGMANGSGSGGSTAWNNTVRSRIYLSRPTGGDSGELGEEDAKGLRELTKMKSNYSTVGDKITLRWVRGAFKVEQGAATDIVSVIEKRNREQEDDKIFLSLLGQLTDDGRTVSDSKQAGTYAPKVMAGMDKGKPIGKKRLIEAMGRLFENKTIDRGFVVLGSDRKKKDGIRRRPVTDCGEVRDGCL